MNSLFLKKQREKHGLTQEYLADALSMSRPTYHKTEQGLRDLTVLEAEKCAEIFNLSLEDFLNNTERSILLTIEPPKKIIPSSHTIRISIPQERIEKFEQVFLYILKRVGGKPNIGMTALYKLLYFIDFDYYEKYEDQLLGLVYIKNHYGPTPVIFEKITKKMIASNQIEIIKSKFYAHEQKKYLINPEITPDLSILNGQEKEHIDWELHRLSDLTAKLLSDLSHKDVPWISAEFSQTLDYESVFYRTPETSVRDYPA